MSIRRSVLGTCLIQIILESRPGCGSIQMGGTVQNKNVIIGYAERANIGPTGHGPNLAPLPQSLRGVSYLLFYHVLLFRGLVFTFFNILMSIHSSFLSNREQHGRSNGGFLRFLLRIHMMTMTRIPSDFHPRTLLGSPEIAHGDAHHASKNNKQVIHPWPTALVQRYPGNLLRRNPLRNTHYHPVSSPSTSLALKNTATNAYLPSSTAAAACRLRAWPVPLPLTSTSLSHLFDCAGTPPHSSHLHFPLGTRTGLCSQTLLPNFPKRGQYVHTTT